MPSDDRPVLVLGATGTTGRRVTGLLADRGVTVRAASRRPTPDARAGVVAIAFDWQDPATHRPALEGARALYLVAPSTDPAPQERLMPMVTLAEQVGVEQIVLLSASAVDAGGPGLGEVHARIATGGARWTALRPSWFMQNLWNPAHPIGAGVRAGGEIVTATGSGRIAFIDAGDIAAVAAAVLTDAAAPDGELVLTGPQALSYDEVATTLSAALDRPVRHRAVAPDDAIDAMTRGGVPAPIARMLAGMDAAIANGAEDRVSDAVAAVTGRPPRSLAAVLDADHPFEQETA